MRRMLWLTCLLALLLVAGSEPVNPIRFTVINKSGMDIAVQLKGSSKACATKNETVEGAFYYLPVAEGTREKPTLKTFIIERDTYVMQVFYMETYDPVYGFKCDPTKPNPMIAARNIRLVILPCGEFPCSPGEPTMWKYIPFPVTQFFKRYWITRLIY